MPRKRYKHIYGPVSSWRLGASLGIDPISRKEKICTFDCLYCQLGGTRVLNDKRRIFVPTKDLIEEVAGLPPIKIDYITFSGRGEPTLAKNLGDMIESIRKIRKEKIAVITNSSLIERKDVQDDLRFADLVMLKLDASSEEIFRDINRPMKGITLDAVLNGIGGFKSGYKGRLALQIMFMKENKDDIGDLAGIAGAIDPDEVQINTPLRPCGVNPLSRKELNNIKEYFKGMNITCVYDAKGKEVTSISRADTLKRRGKI